MNKTKALVLALASLLGLAQGNTYSLANEAAATTRSAQHWKRKTAIAMGRPELSDAPDEDLEAAHDSHVQLINEMADMPDGPAEVTGAENADTRTPEEKAAAEAAAKKASKDPLALANEQLAAQRTENIELQLANAITAGKITVAEKAGWVTKFANDYDGTKVALANEKPKIKISSRTGNLGGSNTIAVANESDRRSQVQGLINEEMSKNGGDYDRAFDTVRVNPKNKALFDAMKKPGAEKAD